MAFNNELEVVSREKAIERFRYIWGLTVNGFVYQTNPGGWVVVKEEYIEERKESLSQSGFNNISFELIERWF